MNRLQKVGLFMLIIGSIGWIHVQMIILLDMNLLTMQLTHHTPWLRTDDFGMISYIQLMIGLALFIKELRK